MTPTPLEQMQTAFSPVQLLDVFIQFSPYILAGIGIFVGISTIVGIIRSMRERLAGESARRQWEDDNS